MNDLEDSGLCEAEGDKLKFIASQRMFGILKSLQLSVGGLDTFVFSDRKSCVVVVGGGAQNIRHSAHCGETVHLAVAPKTNSPLAAKNRKSGHQDSFPFG